jgi:hypothetical protein
MDMVRAKRPSDRSFGCVMALILAIVALAPLRHGEPVRLWVLAPSALLCALALLRPPWLGPLNRAWSALGRAIGWVVAQIALSVGFFLLLTPAGLVRRWLGRDPLRLAFRSGARSHWIRRTNAEPLDVSLRRPY